MMTFSGSKKFFLRTIYTSYREKITNYKPKANY